MDIIRDKYTITELSEELKITDHALRYYEKEFNIKIPKDPRGRRYYTADLANIMYQIKNMRDQGLEIKAIKKILETESINNEESSMECQLPSESLVKVETNDTSHDMALFFEGFKEQLVSSVCAEMGSTKEYLAKEINKSKLELGACVENSMRKLEYKLDKHFAEVDLALGKWRDKKKKGFFRRIFKH